VDTSSAHYESAKTFNYTHIAEAIEKSSAKSFRLLEEMADEIIKQLQQHGNAIRTIDLEIIKKNPVLKQYQGDVFIRICK
jgi:dihydroneopterin aldolase